MKRKVPVILSMLLAAGIASPALTVNAAPSFNPYKTVQAEAKFGDSGVEITTEESGAKVVSSIDKGDYFFVKDVNFSEGLSKITISAKTAGPAVIEVRKGGADGDVLGNIKLSNTNGEYKDFSAAMKNVEGKDTIAFVGAAGTVSIDYWAAEAAQATEPQPEEPTPEEPKPENPVVTDPYSDFQAEAANVKEAATDATAGDATYTSIKANGYIAFKDVDLTKGISGVMLNAKSAAPNTTVDVRVDGVDGQSLGSVKIMSMGAFKNSAVKIDSTLTGKHDLYLVVTNGVADIDSLKLLPGKTTPDPVNPDPVNPDPVNPNPVNPDPVNPDPVNPDPVNPDPVVTEGLNVRYEINSWGTGYVVNFYVDNQSGSTTNGWTVKVRKDQVSIDNSWCVNIKDEGDYYVITPLDWNSHIENGQSIQFGIIGSGSIGNTLDVTVQ